MKHYAKLCQKRGRMVGAVGFEPTTPTPPEYSPTAKLLKDNDGSVISRRFRSESVCNHFRQSVPKLCDRGRP